MESSRPLKHLCSVSRGAPTLEAGQGLKTLALHEANLAVVRVFRPGEIPPRVSRPWPYPKPTSMWPPGLQTRGNPGQGSQDPGPYPPRSQPRCGPRVFRPGEIPAKGLRPWPYTKLDVAPGSSDPGATRSQPRCGPRGRVSRPWPYTKPTSLSRSSDPGKSRPRVSSQANLAVGVKTLALPEANLAVAPGSSEDPGPGPRVFRSPGLAVKPRSQPRSGLQTRGNPGQGSQDPGPTRSQPRCGPRVFRPGGIPAKGLKTLALHEANLAVAPGSSDPGGSRPRVSRPWPYIGIERAQSEIESATGVVRWFQINRTSRRVGDGATPRARLAAPMRKTSDHWRNSTR